MNENGQTENKDTLLNPNIPVAHRKKVLDLIEFLDGKHGFKRTDFLPPEPTDTDTAQIGWRLKLKTYPNYFFFSRVVNREIFIKRLPNPNENKEQSFKIVSNNGKMDEVVRTQAEAWLKIIHDETREHQRWKSFFDSIHSPDSDNTANSSEFVDYEIVNEEESENELTQDEIENVRIFLNAFDDLIQNSKTLPQETKEIFSQGKREAEEELEKKPTKKFYRWLDKLFNDMLIKFITTKSFREEVISYAQQAGEKIGAAFEWVKGLGEGNH